MRFGLLAIASVALISTGVQAQSFRRPGIGKNAPTTPTPTPVPSAEDPVTLPYGFTWGDSMDMVFTSLPRVKAKVKEKKPLGDRGEIWVLTGIEVPGLRESRAIFQEKQLVGLDLEYGAPDWPMEKFRGAMSNLRRKLEGMFAVPGTMLKRGPVEGNEDSGVDQILTGYEWRRGDTIVLLVYFSAEKKGSVSPKDAFRSMTIRYRFQAPTAEPPKETPKEVVKEIPKEVPKESPKPGTDPLPEPGADSSPVVARELPEIHPEAVPDATPEASPEPSK